MDIEKKLVDELGKNIIEATNEEIYRALVSVVNKAAIDKEERNGKKKLYYISAEFLIGKLLSNNLINLGLFDEVHELLEKNGKNLGDIEELDAEPSLGNGGLGRLASCFLDSIATLGLNGDGVGLNYHMGLFKQTFKDRLQSEIPDKWIDKDTFLIKTDVSYPVSMGGKMYNSVMYDLLVTGYENRTNRLHLFDLETIDSSIIKNGIDFDKEAVDKNLTLFLYPDDSDEAGRKLRIYQQYFMVCNAAHLILDEAVSKGSDLYNLDEYVVIQINDTHPTMVIPELIRQLMERGLSIDDAIEITNKCCAYTNHTILAEALEKWPIGYLKSIVPQIVPIIEVLDDRIRRKYEDESIAIIDRNDFVSMAAIDINYGYSVNGVAGLHTEILKNTELNNFYKIYPEKFNNKTNGITFRRWLMSCNPSLTKYLEELIGEGFIKDSFLLKKLEEYKDDKNVLNKLSEIKMQNKQAFCDYIEKTRGIILDKDTIFDVQSKRLHEYKRQQLNLLWAIRRYLDIKAGIIPEERVTVIFGAKAAPAYTIAKDIIHAILSLMQLIENDEDVKKYLRVIMLDNYNVDVAEKLIPACDISEQISLASKEASGTGNMKYMLNGAVTLGTMDGANVEIFENVGEENIYIFGLSSDEVIAKYKNGSYDPKYYYDNNAEIKRAVDFLVSKEMIGLSGKDHDESLERLYNEFLNKDYFMTFPDFDEYCKVRNKAHSDYKNQDEWSRKCLLNIANAGYFSSDRTIEEYNRDIWKLQ
ncbi:starch phosphorylase [Eubacterium ruminantium]|uniref:Alpha-1,4 glucan phosphorylase n=1 Tax=Eubacterium ruminantium TaxID=42322 RepID=A0A1T4PZL0_9FIRM|nr:MULTISPECIES: glycogen/starch/alpha-glucan phosphorylase [Eubacterium]MCR5368659.1 glycogen/starch/alpha-glucan family phosphorylase [Eubacterium sp.]SCW65005.1 starch phosphorylase [Eubacterium ruminantium]SDN23171.1 starch phosphorylase [Eubacterium ruminantium]SJZ96398.1 starch phosphorylase [Eubacterium ruminantium]